MLRGMRPTFQRERIAPVAGLVFPGSGDEVVQATERLADDRRGLRLRLDHGQPVGDHHQGHCCLGRRIGVPIAAVNLFESVSGLGAAGRFTSGLAAQGFGGLPGPTAPWSPGLARWRSSGSRSIRAPALRAGHQRARQREHRREHLIQQVVKNHQQAMAESTRTTSLGSLTGWRLTSPRPPRNRTATRHAQG